MTKSEASLILVAKEITPHFDFDLPQWVIEGHIHAALECLVHGLSRSQELATSGAILGEQCFCYKLPEPK